MRLREEVRVSDDGSKNTMPMMRALDNRFFLSSVSLLFEGTDKDARRDNGL